MPEPDRFLAETYAFCVAHTRPLLDLPDYVEVIGTADYQGEGRLNVRDSREPLLANPPYLAGSAGFYYIAEILKGRPTAGKRVLSLLHRRFLAQEPVGERSAANPILRVIPSFPRAELDRILRSYAAPVVVPMPIFFAGGILDQFARAHHVEDFLRLTDHAVRAGALSPLGVADFCSSRLLIPCGCNLGIIPCDWFIEIMERCFAAAKRYVEHERPLEPDHPYQSRAVSFFQERLSSYLLLQKLGWAGLARLPEPAGIPAAMVGEMVVITEGDYALGNIPVG